MARRLKDETAVAIDDFEGARLYRENGTQFELYALNGHFSGAAEGLLPLLPGSIT